MLFFSIQFLNKFWIFIWGRKTYSVEGGLSDKIIDLRDFKQYFLLKYNKNEHIPIKK